MSGYLRAGGSGRISGASSFAAAVAAHVNFLRVMVDQALDDPEHSEFAERNVVAMLTRGFVPFHDTVLALARATCGG